MNFSKNDIITTDEYFNFCNENDICYIKTDYFYTGQINWRGQKHPSRIDDICVIGHSDYPVNDRISERFKKVFCINNQSSNTNTFGIPLGITNDCDDSPLHSFKGRSSSQCNAPFVISCLGIPMRKPCTVEPCAEKLQA